MCRSLSGFVLSFSSRSRAYGKELGGACRGERDGQCTVARRSLACRAVQPNTVLSVLCGKCRLSNRANFSISSRFLLSLPTSTPRTRSTATMTLIQLSLLGAAAVVLYYASVVSHRLETQRRTRAFQLDQRRKAGIPDSDDRPYSVARADAIRKRNEQAQLAKQAQQPPPLVSTARPGYIRKRHEPLLPSVSPVRAIPQTQTIPLEYEYDSPARKHARSEAGSTVVQTKKSRKTADRDRDMDRDRGLSRKRAPSEVTEREPKRVHRIQAQVPEPISDDDMASLSDGTPPPPSSPPPRGTKRDLDSESSVSTPAKRTVARPTRTKRKADTSDDREPGDEWTDLNGLKWRVGEDGVRRRATVVVEMRPKYAMPKDSTHPDAKQKIQVYVEKFLTEHEYEEARRRKQLGFQEAERQREAEARAKAEEEASRSPQSRNTLTPRKMRTDLLYSDTPLRASRSDISLRRSVAAATPPPQAVGAAGSKSRRISLAASASAGSSPRPSPSRRTGLDEESKKRREEALLRKLRDEKLRSSSNSPDPAGTGAPPPPTSTKPEETKAASGGVAGGFSFGTSKSEETKPAPAKAEEAKPAPAASAEFSFGSAPTPPKLEEKKPDAPASGGFSFGAPKTDDKKPAPSSGAGATATFSFGAPAPPKTEQAKPAASNAGFSFGAPAAAGGEKKPDASVGFSFGTATASKPAASTFTFGTGTGPAESTETANGSGSASGFSFSTAKPAGDDTGQQQNATNAKPAESKPSFTFGAPPATPAAAPTNTPSFTFGTSSSNNASSSSASGGRFSFTFGKT